jgi:hypothetical protein
MSAPRKRDDQQTIAALKKKLAKLEAKAKVEAEVAGSGAVAQGDAVAVGAHGVAARGDIAGSFVNTGRIEGNVYLGAATDHPENAL